MTQKSKPCISTTQSLLDLALDYGCGLDSQFFSGRGEVISSLVWIAFKIGLRKDAEHFINVCVYLYVAFALECRIYIVSFTLCTLCKTYFPFKNTLQLTPVAD